MKKIKLPSLKYCNLIQLYLNFKQAITNLSSNSGMTSSPKVQQKILTEAQYKKNKEIYEMELQMSKKYPKTL